MGNVQGVAWETLLAGAGDRFDLDYVLVRPPEAFHSTRAIGFPDRQWRAVLGNRPGVNVEASTAATAAAPSAGWGARSARAPLTVPSGPTTNVTRTSPAASPASGG